MSEAQALRHPALELLGRYRAILQAAWQARHDLVGPKRLADEVAFLPAALSLQETPLHPAPRRVAIAICALFAGALVWSILGEIDIVAVAAGRIVVSERTKIIQPLETSVVIHSCRNLNEWHRSNGLLCQCGDSECELRQRLFYRTKSARCSTS